MTTTESTFFCKYSVTFSFVHLQASLPELTISESDPGPARLILYSTLPITCQGVARDNSPVHCWIKFTIRSSDDIAVRQRRTTPDSGAKNLCIYQLDEEDWKAHESRAYDGNKSLDILTKVLFVVKWRVPFINMQGVHLRVLVGYLLCGSLNTTLI